MTTGLPTSYSYFYFKGAAFQRNNIIKITKNNINTAFILLSRVCLGLLATFFQCYWAATKNLLFTFTEKKLTFFRYYYNGLGYKLFCKWGYLFIWIGLTHYTLIPIPSSIKIFAKKRRIYLIASTGADLFNEFLSSIRRIRKIDIYKGKGLSEIKTYKGFIKMKSGKKKQY